MSDIRHYAPVRDFLLDVEIYDVLEDVAKKHGIPTDRVEEFLDLTDAVIRGDISMDQMPAMLEKAFGLKTNQANQVAADLAGYALLPLEHYISGVADYISSWGGRVSNYPTTRVQKEKESADTFVDELAENIGLELPEDLMDRFRYLATGYLTKQRAKDATKKILMRSVNIGGLDFSEEMVDNFFNTLDEASKGVEFSAEEVHPEVKKPFAPAEKVSEDEKDTSVVTSAESSLQVVDDLADSPPDQSTVFKQKDKYEQMTYDELMADIRSRLPEGISFADDEAPVTSWDEVMDSLDKHVDVEAEKRSIREHVQKFEEARAEQLRVAKEMVDKEVNRILAPLTVVFKRYNVAPAIFKEIALGYVKEGQNREDVKKRLRDEYGFSAENIEEVLRVLKRARDFTQGEIDTSLMEAPTTALTTSVPVIAGHDFIHPDVSELADRRKMARISSAVTKDVERAVNDALRPVAIYFKEHNISKDHFSKVATAHVRGIRDIHQTERLLRDLVSVGDVDALMKSLEEARGIYHGGAEGAQSAIQQEAVREKESALLNLRHAAMTKKISDDPIDPVVPNARVSAARSKDEELSLQTERLKTVDLNAARETSKPAPAKAKVSAQTVIERSRVTDVIPSAKPVGPVGELRTMHVAEFRRLSSDPVEAAQKILDKLDLLEQTAFEDRIAGVNAWRMSPVNKLYLEMVKEALQSGKSVPEIATDRRNAGKESLSPAEVKAIVMVNNKIKF